jgi:phage gpG-like protein
MTPFVASVEGADAVRARLLIAPDRVRAAVRRAVDQSAASVLRGAKAKVSDDVLNVKTGRLRRSLSMRTAGGLDTPSAEVGTNVVYAAIHEYGGQTKAHIIEAINGKALAFMGKDGSMVFRQIVHHPGSRMPEHSFLRSTLTEQAPEIQERIVGAVKGELP